MYAENILYDSKAISLASTVGKTCTHGLLVCFLFLIKTLAKSYLWRKRVHFSLQFIVHIEEKLEESLTKFPGGQN